MAVTQLPPISCPSSAVQNAQCPNEIGQFIFDTTGCLRKVCPITSQLCNVRKGISWICFSSYIIIKFFFSLIIQTIRCPPDRICRVVPCKSCHYTNYLQAVCEYRHGM